MTEKIWAVYYQAPDYTSRPSLPRFAFTSEELADAWIATKPGWSGIGQNTDYYKIELEVNPQSEAPSRCTCPTKEGEGPEAKHYLRCAIWKDRLK